MVPIRNQSRQAELALGLGRLGGEDMPHLRLAALNLAATSLLEALGRASMCLQLWHGFPNRKNSLNNVFQYTTKSSLKAIPRQMRRVGQENGGFWC